MRFKSARLELRNYCLGLTCSIVVFGDGLCYDKWLPFVDCPWKGPRREFSHTSPIIPIPQTKLAHQGLYNPAYVRQN